MGETPLAVYQVLTWDAERQTYTPQRGIATPVFGAGGLKRALRELEKHGYSARKGDSSVMIQRIAG